jgi:hypothetical protein
MNFLNLLAIKDMGHGLIIGSTVMMVCPAVVQLRLLRSLPYLSAISFALALSLGAVYLIYPNYFDHAEPTVTVIGQIVAAGGQAYPQGTDWQFNGLVYGPGLYLLNAIGTQLFDPILGSKLPGVLSYSFGLLLLWWFLPSPIPRAMLVLTYLFYEFGFWNRPESHLLFLTALGVALVTRPQKWTLLCLGILAGVATTFKFTGFLFFVPFALVVSFQKINWPKLLFAGILGISVAWLPYALPVFNFYNHFAYIQTLATQTLSASILQSNLAYAFFSFLPVIWLWFTQRNNLQARGIGLIILVDVVIEILVCIAASKPGAGPHHLLPGLPIKIWLVHQLTQNPVLASGRAYRFIGLVVFVMTSYYLCYGYQKFLRVHLISVDFVNKQLAAKQELINLINKNQNVFLAVSDEKHVNYSLSFYRPYAFGPNYRDKLDPVAFMEVNYTLKVDDALLKQKIKDCKYPSIFLPSIGQPFTLSNFYTNRSLFTDDLRSTFNQSYKKTYEGKYYDVYICK